MLLDCWMCDYRVYSSSKRWKSKNLVLFSRYSPHPQEKIPKRGNNVLFGKLISFQYAFIHNAFFLIQTT